MVTARFLQEKQSVHTPAWVNSLQKKDVGSFIVDAPMGLDGQPAFTLDQITQLIKLIHGTYDPPYSIIIYSLYSMGEVQRSVDPPEEAVNKSVEGSQEKVQVTKFVMVKVRVRHTLSYIIPMAVRAASRSQTYLLLFLL